MKAKLLSGIVAMLTLLGICTAQSGGGYDLSWWTIDGGGHHLRHRRHFRSGWHSRAARRQQRACTGGAFRLTGGFWFTPCIISNGDVDGNSCVDDADLLNVLLNFGATGLNPADLNCDGTVDDADLLTVLLNFGSGC
jgi:hypothetical protein